MGSCELRLLLDAYLDYLRLECGLSENTVIAYRHDLELLLEHLFGSAIHDAAAVRAENLAAFFAAQRLAGMSDRTQARRVSAVRMFFRFISVERKQDDPAEHLLPPKLASTLPDYLTSEHVQRLLDAPTGIEPLKLRDRAILHTLYATGARVSEVCNLTLSRMHLDAGYLSVRGKGNKERVVPISAAASEHVKHWLERGRNQLLRAPIDFVYLSRTGKRLARARVWDVVREYAALAGLPRTDVHPHTLRHCFATHMIENGADIRSVQEMLGHVSISTTQVYTHVDQKRLRSVVLRFHPRAG
jgi:integrase/recombinase XerD